MTKVHGKRYAYKFDFHGLMMACQAQTAAGGAGPVQNGTPGMAPGFSLPMHDSHFTGLGHHTQHGLKSHPTVQTDVYQTNGPGKAVTSSTSLDRSAGQSTTTGHSGLFAGVPPYWSYAGFEHRSTGFSN